MTIEFSKKIIGIWMVGTIIFSIQIWLLWDIQRSVRPLPDWLYSPTFIFYVSIPALCLFMAGIYQGKNKKKSALIAAGVPAIVPITTALAFIGSIKAIQFFI